MDEQASRCCVNASSTPCKYTQKDFFTCCLAQFHQASGLHRECVRTRELRQTTLNCAKLYDFPQILAHFLKYYMVLPQPR